MNKKTTILVLLSCLFFVNAAEAGKQGRFARWFGKKSKATATRHHKDTRSTGDSVANSLSGTRAGAAAPAAATPARPDRDAVLSAARTTRSLAGSTRFNASFDAVVKDINALYAAGEIAASREAAIDALHGYMDHNNLSLGYTPSAKVFFAKQYAAKAGLKSVLGW